MRFVNKRGNDRSVTMINEYISIREILVRRKIKIHDDDTVYSYAYFYTK